MLEWTMKLTVKFYDSRRYSFVLCSSFFCPFPHWRTSEQSPLLQVWLHIMDNRTHSINSTTANKICMLPLTSKGGAWRKANTSQNRPGVGWRLIRHTVESSIALVRTIPWSIPMIQSLFSPGIRGTSFHFVLCVGYYWKLIFKGSYWKVSRWEGQRCQSVFSNYFPKSSIKNSTLSLQTPRETAVGHPQQVPFWWKVANASHAPGTRIVCSAFHSIKAIVSQFGALRTAYRPMGTDCKVTMPWCLFARHPTASSSGSVISTWV